MDAHHFVTIPKDTQTHIQTNLTCIDKYSMRKGILLDWKHNKSVCVILAVSNALAFYHSQPKIKIDCHEKFFQYENVKENLFTIFRLILNVACMKYILSVSVIAATTPIEYQ